MAGKPKLAANPLYTSHIRTFVTPLFDRALRALVEPAGVTDAERDQIHLELLNLAAAVAESKQSSPTPSAEGEPAA